MYIYVLDINGQPLMPTCRCGKVRRMLKSGKATVIKRCPFTIQLQYESTNHTQNVVLGVDAGSKTIGISASTKQKELYVSEVMLRTDIVELLSTRRELRRSRRYRKTRYRKCRFDRTKPKGWLPPSTLNKIESHINEIGFVCSILPVGKIRVEVAAFDIQKIKNPDIKGVEYQRGEMYGWNVREYVLWRDGHQCKCCLGKQKDIVLETHHIESRKTGGDAPNNLVTLCKTCHSGYHAGSVKLPSNLHRGTKYSDAVFMSTMRWAFYNKLKELYDVKGIDVCLTYGYITKNTRIAHRFAKTHAVDARCISGNASAEPLDYVYFRKKIRCHNRQIHKSKILKGGIRKRNQAEYLIKGFRRYDKVMYNGKECFINGRRATGYFAIKTIDGEKVHDSVKCSDIRFVETQHNYITERRTRIQEFLPPSHRQSYDDDEQYNIA